MFEKFYALSVDSQNIGIPSAPDFGGRSINFCSMLEQFMPLVIASKD